MSNEAAELRALAEETLIWQDEWDSQPSDGSAVQNFIDAASPRAVLAALDAERRMVVERLRAAWFDHPAIQDGGAYRCACEGAGHHTDIEKTFAVILEDEIGSAR